MKYYAIDSTVSIDKATDAAALRAAFHRDQEVVCFTNYQDAVRAAKDAIDAKAKAQYPIYEIEFKGRKGRKSVTMTLENGDEVAAFNITPDQVEDFVLVNASFEHVNKKLKAINLSELAEEKEKETEIEVEAENTKDAAAKKLSNSYNNVASATAATVVAATSFWFSGLYPATISLLAKAGLALPAAAVTVQVGVSLAIGLAAVAILGAAYYGINKMLGTSRTIAEPVTCIDSRTESQKYSDKLKSKEEKIKARSEKLTSEQDKKFLTDLHAILDIEHTAERKFKKDGELMNIKRQPAAVDKLLVLKYEAKRLKEVAAVEGDARDKLEATVLDNAKKDAAKKFAA